MKAATLIASGATSATSRGWVSEGGSGKAYVMAWSPLTRLTQESATSHRLLIPPVPALGRMHACRHKTSLPLSHTVPLSHTALNRRCKTLAHRSGARAHRLLGEHFPESDHAGVPSRYVMTNESDHKWSQMRVITLDDLPGTWTFSCPVTCRASIQALASKLERRRVWLAQRRNTTHTIVCRHNQGG